MSELSRLAQPLLKRPIVQAPPIEHLRQRNKRRHRRRIVSGGTTVVGLVLVVALVIALLPTSSKPLIGPNQKSSLALYVQKGVSVPNSTLEAVGLPATTTPPSSVARTALLTDGGKPAVVYVGAEFCPYCAMQRW